MCPSQHVTGMSIIAAPLECGHVEHVILCLDLDCVCDAYELCRKRPEMVTTKIRAAAPRAMSKASESALRGVRVFVLLLGLQAIRGEGFFCDNLDCTDYTITAM
eukprot:1026981-Pleurochrysis_carterae.AAC.3